MNRVIVASTFPSLDRSHFLGNVEQAVEKIGGFTIQPIANKSPQELASQVAVAIQEAVSSGDKIAVATNSSRNNKANEFIFKAIAELFESASIGSKEIFIGSAEAPRADENISVVAVRSAAELLSVVEAQASQGQLIAPVYSLVSASQNPDAMFAWLDAIAKYKTPEAAGIPQPLHP